MALAFVNAAHTQRTTNGTTIVVTTSAIAAGNFLIVGVGLPNNTSTVTNVTDNVANNYQFYKRIVNGTTDAIELWICPAAVASATSVTVTMSASQRGTAVVGQYSGHLDDNGKAATATAATSPMTISITTADNNNFVLAVFTIKNASTLTILTGNLRDSIVGTTTNPAIALVDNTSATPAAVTCAVTLGTAAAWSGAAFELKSVAPSGSMANNTQQQMKCGI